MAGNYAGSEARTASWPLGWRTIEGYRDKYPRTSPVGSFQANVYGIYDLGGNVWEWCQDWWNAKKQHRVLRGASWRNAVPDGMLSSFRDDNMPEFRNDLYGFRCVLSGSEVVSAKDESNLQSAAVIPTAQDNAGKLVRVHIKKYGLSAVIPIDTFPDAQKLSAGEQDSLRGNSWSGLTTLTFSSVRRPLAEVYAEYAIEHPANAPDRIANYKILKPTWFVVSGDMGPVNGIYMGFYIKGVKKDRDVVMMRLEYRDGDFPFSEETFNALSRGFDGK
jgi:hypothetical protein